MQLNNENQNKLVNDYKRQNLPAILIIKGTQCNCKKGKSLAGIKYM